MPTELGGEGARVWLMELTESITSQLRQNREDIVDIYSQIREAREHHTVCREHILNELAKMDKRLEVIMVRIGIYVAIVTFFLSASLEFVLKHWLR